MSEPARQIDDAELRHLPVPAGIPEARPIERTPRTELQRLLGNVPAPAIAAAGGFVMGVVTWVAMRVLRGGRRGSRLGGRRGKRGIEVAATRSFLVDVHLLKDR